MFREKTEGTPKALPRKPRAKSQKPREEVEKVPVQQSGVENSKNERKKERELDEMERRPSRDRSN